MINVALTYRRVVDDMNVFSFLLVSSICRSTKKRFERCSILERQHCRSVSRSTIVWRNDINTLERYLIRATPHTTTLSHLIDVESRLIYSSFFGGVSKVATRLDYDVWYFDVHLVRGRATIVSYAFRRCSPTPRWSPHSTSTMIHVALTYRRVVDGINVFSSCVKYMSKYIETFWNVFNTRAAALPLGM